MSERLRREPPRFRRLAVRTVAPVTARLVRVTLGGDELEGFALEAPAASVRLLLSDEVPVWHGNEFLLADGTRPVIRTLTPLRHDPEARTVDVEVVLHDGGAVSSWASSVAIGDEVALSGPGRGYVIDPAVPSYVLAGDETALPAITQLVEAMPNGVATTVVVEVASDEARLPALPNAEWHLLPPGATPGDALVDAVRAVDLTAVASGGRMWVAGEAAAVQRIRKYLFEERGLTRSQATVRGYWKHGRAGGSEED